MTERRRSEVPATALGFPAREAPVDRAVTGEPVGAKRTLVVLEIHDDNHDREWWEGMGLPDPAYWAMDEAFDGRVFIEAHVERVVVK